MLPQSTEIYGSWPVSGEIDIMETCGKFTDKGNNVACGTLHWGVPDCVYKGSGSFFSLRPEWNEEYEVHEAGSPLALHNGGFTKIKLYATIEGKKH